MSQKARRLRGHEETIGERYARDRAAFLPLPASAYEACEKQMAQVSSMSLVRYRTNDYSAPTEYGYRDVLVKVYVHEVVVVCGSEVIARHPRSYEREDVVFEPLHYLALLERKPRALDQAAPLAGWELPECSPVCGGCWKHGCTRAASASIYKCCVYWRRSPCQRSKWPLSMRCIWARSVSMRSSICCCAASTSDRRGWTWRTIRICRGPTYRLRRPPTTWRCSRLRPSRPRRLPLPR